MLGILLFFETDLDIPKVTTQLSQSGSKVIQSYFYTPEMAPKRPQSDPDYAHM